MGLIGAAFGLGFTIGPFIGEGLSLPQKMVLFQEPLQYVSISFAIVAVIIVISLSVSCVPIDRLPESLEKQSEFQ